MELRNAFCLKSCLAVNYLSKLGVCGGIGFPSVPLSSEKTSLCFFMLSFVRSMTLKGDCGSMFRERIGSVIAASALVLALNSDSELEQSLPIELSPSATSLRVVDTDLPPVIGPTVAWV